MSSSKSIPSGTIAATDSSKLDETKRAWPPTGMLVAERLEDDDDDNTAKPKRIWGNSMLSRSTQLGKHQYGEAEPKPQQTEAASPSKREDGRDRSVHATSNDVDWSSRGVERLDSRAFDSLVSKKERVAMHRGLLHVPSTEKEEREEIVGRSWRDVDSGQGNWRSREGEDEAIATELAVSEDELLQTSDAARNAQGKWGAPGSSVRRTASGSAIAESTVNDDNDDSWTTVQRRGNSFPPADGRKYRDRYNVKGGKRTRNGHSWAKLHRGLIIQAIDSGRLQTGNAQANSLDVYKIKGRRRMFKNRFFLVIDRMEEHLNVRPISTHSGKGLKFQPASITKDSMCIYPLGETEQSGWVNEGLPNEVLYLKQSHSSVPISGMATVRATQAMMVDQGEDIEIIAEMAEMDVEKVEALEWKLKLEYRNSE